MIYWQVSYREKGKRKYLHYSTLKKATHEIRMLYMDMIEDDNLPMGTKTINLQLKSVEGSGQPKILDGIPYKEFLKNKERK